MSIACVCVLRRFKTYPHGEPSGSWRLRKEAQDKGQSGLHSETLPKEKKREREKERERERKDLSS
jgi:hypothetical protein